MSILLPRLGEAGVCGWFKAGVDGAEFGGKPFLLLALSGRSGEFEMVGVCASLRVAFGVGFVFCSKGETTVSRMCRIGEVSPNERLSPDFFFFFKLKT